MDDSAAIAHPKFRMWLTPDGVVQLVWAPQARMEFEDAVAATEAMATLTGGTAAPLQVDMRESGPQDRSARMEFVRRGDMVTAVALVVGTPLSRVLGNFFIAVGKPMVPTQMFDDETAALEWLRGYAP